MIRLGHVYDGLMVNLRTDNAKLRRRAVETLAAITGAGEGEAAAALDRAGGRVKAAALRFSRGARPPAGGRADARTAAGGNLACRARATSN